MIRRREMQRRSQMSIAAVGDIADATIGIEPMDSISAVGSVT